MPAALKTLGGLVLGKLGSGERVKFIVKTARTLYASGATLIVLTWYSAWRNERVPPGSGRFPFPGIQKMRPRFSPDRPGKDTDPGYSPAGGMVMSSGGSAITITGKGGEGPPDWGGAKAVAEALFIGTGLSKMSLKRSTETTSSGSVSDHYIGCKKCYAIDASGSVPDMDRAARVIMSRLGAHYTGGELVHTVERSGYRIQILYRTYVGGNHFDHIHIGVRKVGYEP